MQYIFVHGLSGWGSYDAAYRRMPYWGMRGGDLMAWLRDQGFDCRAASVAPTGSAWDRACELYAQMVGAQVDYGAAHSRRYQHSRFGRDFSDCHLIPSWDDETRLVLLGHSFGGTTVRLFAELLAHGDGEERQATPAEELSPFFLGGLSGRIHSVVTLASPMNGTTAYDMFHDPDFDPFSVPVSFKSKALARMMSMGVSPKQNGRDERDYAGFDMHLDRARELNERISTLPDVYYFSVPCSFTGPGPDGKQLPKHGIEPLFAMRSAQIGAYTGHTAGGIRVDESWRENDGLVNTISARAPSGTPWKPLGQHRTE